MFITNILFSFMSFLKRIFIAVGVYVVPSGKKTDDQISHTQKIRRMWR